MNLCCTCRHFLPAYTQAGVLPGGACQLAALGPDPVYGHAMYEDARTARQPGKACGPTGQLHAPRSGPEAPQ